MLSQKLENGNLYLETPFVKLELQPNGLLIASYKAGTSIDLPSARQIVCDRLEFTSYQTVPVLLYIEGIVTIKREAREFISSPRGVQCLSAAAIMQDSAFAAVVGNLFITLNHPLKIPVKVCTNRQKAIRFLNKYLPVETSPDNGQANT